jgi:hypothetical protein
MDLMSIKFFPATCVYQWIMASTAAGVPLSPRLIEAVRDI